jgi:hypothetical protein
MVSLKNIPFQINDDTGARGNEAHGTSDLQVARNLARPPGYQAIRSSGYALRKPTTTPNKVTLNRGHGIIV